mgnify:CR=1 FL=1
MPHVASTCMCRINIRLNCVIVKIVTNNTNGVLAPQLQIGNTNYRKIRLLLFSGYSTDAKLI